MRTHRIEPVAKPRQTRSDRWKKRPAVLRYRSFADAARASGLSVAPGCGIVFFLSIPASWSAKKRLEHDGVAHRQRPDIDNLVKSVLDATMPEDCSLYDISCLQKRWAPEGAIVVLSPDEVHRCFNALRFERLPLADLALLVAS